MMNFKVSLYLQDLNLRIHRRLRLRRASSRHDPALRRRADVAAVSGVSANPTAKPPPATSTGPRKPNSTICGARSAPTPTPRPRYPQRRSARWISPSWSTPPSWPTCSPIRGTRWFWAERRWCTRTGLSPRSGWKCSTPVGREVFRHFSGRVEWDGIGAFVLVEFQSGRRGAVDGVEGADWWMPAVAELSRSSMIRSVRDQPEFLPQWSVQHFPGKTSPWRSIVLRKHLCQSKKLFPIIIALNKWLFIETNLKFV